MGALKGLGYLKKHFSLTCSGMWYVVMQTALVSDKPWYNGVEIAIV